MKISVEMTSEEFMELMNWKKDRACYEKEVDKIYGEQELLHKKILIAVEEDPKKPGKYKIVDQDQMGELVDMANEFFA